MDIQTFTDASTFISKSTSNIYVLTYIFIWMNSLFTNSMIPSNLPEITGPETVADKAYFCLQYIKAFTDMSAVQGMSVQLGFITMLKNESCNDESFVISGGTAGCHHDNLQCHQWWQSWQYENSQFH